MLAITQLNRWWKNTKEMPFLMRLLCQGGMVAGPILLFFLLAPIADWTVNGRRISYGELWSSGAGASFALFIALIILGSWGLAARKPISRWAVVLAPVAPYAVLLAFPNSWLTADSISVSVLMQAFIAAALMYFCLFHLKGIRRYLERSSTNDEKSA